MHLRSFGGGIFLALVLFFPFMVRAEGLDPALQAVVWVQCGNRQGSGSVINGEKGYVLTDAHVVTNVNTGKSAVSCTVAFMNLVTAKPSYFYEAAILKQVFDDAKSRDFAILQIGRQLTEQGLPRPFPSLKTNEFPFIGQQIGVYGFSQGGDHLITRSGVIQKFLNGFIETDAEISPGDSGGAALDKNFRLVGIPNRIITMTSEVDKTLRVAYELEDIRMVMTWLDTFGINDHDQYFTHEDYNRYHQNAVFISDADLDCQYLARTTLSTTVYCLMNGGNRMIFPNDATFLSWFPNFNGVVLSDPKGVSDYPPDRNVTFKPGTLVKSQTAPQVYVVVDSFGTLRWIPSEQKATQLWGPSWAALVKDIPDEFWTNYTVGQSIDG